MSFFLYHTSFTVPPLGGHNDGLDQANAQMKAIRDNKDLSHKLEDGQHSDFVDENHVVTLNSCQVGEQVVDSVLNDDNMRESCDSN